jgi:magnesium transporter
MSPAKTIAELDEPVLRHAQPVALALGAHQTVGEALDSIRAQGGSAGSSLYFYVADDQQRLAGVLQVRKLLTAPLEARLEAIMTRQVVAIPDSFTVLEACELFVLHKYLAFPVVDARRKILGVVDVSLFTEEMFDLQERDQMHSLFETLGVRLAELRDRSPWGTFRLRFPWLLGTITSGMVCAVLVGLFEVTLAKSLILAFFVTMVLGLGESVAMQTMALVTHRLHHQAAQQGWYLQLLPRELLRTLLLALACAGVVGLLAYLWRREALPALVIAGGIFGALLFASFAGVSVPALLHRLRLDLRVASGPLTLALTDIGTITIYFALAAALLGG